jgi:hypothetical protein
MQFQQSVTPDLIRKISIENEIHYGAFFSWFEEMNLGLAWTAWV